MLGQFVYLEIIVKGDNSEIALFLRSLREAKLWEMVNFHQKIRNESDQKGHILFCVATLKKGY